MHSEHQYLKYSVTIQTSISYTISQKKKKYVNKIKVVLPNLVVINFVNKTTKYLKNEAIKPLGKLK